MHKKIFITKPLLPDLTKLNKELQDIWQSGILTNEGPKLKLLEKNLKDYLKVDNLALYNNATSALMIAIMALDLKGEVITTPFTFAATVNSLVWNNLTPVFCDIDETTTCIDADKIEQLITDKTSAILATHVYGMPCDTKKISEIAKKHNLKVIYDAAHAFKVERNGRSILTEGDASILSFHATKLFNTAEGGAIIFNDSKLEEKLRLLKNFGIANEEEVLYPGMNGKMNEIQAVIGLLNLELADEEIAKRQKITSYYENNLANQKGIRFLDFPKNISRSYQYFPIIIDENEGSVSRDFINENLRNKNIISRKYFSPLCSNFSFYQHLESAKKENLPIANKIVNQVLCLPLYGELTNKEVDFICDIIKNKV